MNTLPSNTRVPSSSGDMSAWYGQMVSQDPGYLQRRLQGDPCKDDHFLQDRALRRDVNDALRELALRDIALTEEGLHPLISEVEDIYRHQVTELKRRLEALRAEVRRMVETRELSGQTMQEKIDQLERRIVGLEGPATRLCQLEKECLEYMKRCLEQVQEVRPLLQDMQARIQQLETP